MTQRNTPFVSDGWPVLGSMELHPCPATDQHTRCEARTAFYLVKAGEVASRTLVFPKTRGQRDRQEAAEARPRPDCACAEPAAPRTGSRRGWPKAARGEHCGRLAGEARGALEMKSEGEGGRLGLGWGSCAGLRCTRAK